MAPSIKSRKTSIKRSGTIAGFRDTLRKLGSCHRVSQPPNEEDEGKEEEKEIERVWEKPIVLAGADYKARHAFYDKEEQELLQQLDYYREGPFQDLLAPGYKSPSIKHVSTDTAFSMTQWRSTPSPKPLRTNWSELPGTPDPDPIYNVAAEQTESDDSNPIKNSLSRKITQWHNSMKQAKQPAPAPPTSPILYRPLAMLTSEVPKLRVKNWTLGDRLHKQWMNDGPPLLPFEEPGSTSPSKPVENDNAKTALPNLNKSLPPTTLSSSPSKLSSDVSAPKQELPSSSQGPVTRKATPSKISIPAGRTELDKQHIATPQTSQPKTPIAEPLTPSRRFAERNLDALPVEPIQRSKRMGMIFSPSAADSRNIPAEALKPGPHGDGSRYRIYDTVTDQYADLEDGKWYSSSSQLVHSKHANQEQPNTCPHCSRPLDSEFLPDQDSNPARPRNHSVTSGPHDCTTSYVDSGTQMDMQRAKQIIIRFVANLDGEQYKGSASFAGKVPEELLEALAMFLGGEIHLSLIGKKVTRQTEAKEAAMAPTESSAARSANAKPDRPRLAMTQPAEPMPPVPAVPASAQTATKAPTQAPSTPTQHPALLTPGLGRAPQAPRGPTPSRSAHPPSLTPSQRQTPAGTSPRPSPHPAALTPGAIAKRQRRNREQATSPETTTATAAEGKPLTLDLPDTQIDMSAVRDRSDAQYSYVEPVQQNFSRPTTGGRRRRRSPRQRMAPEERKPMTAKERAREREFRLES